MMGYVPRIFPQSYVQVNNRFNGLGETYSQPPLVQAGAATNSQSGGFLSLIGGLVGNAMQSGTQSSFEFNAAAGQLEAARLARERSRRWASFGALAVGVAGLAGVVYLLKR